LVFENLTIEGYQLLILAAHTTTPELGIALTREEKLIKELILKPGKEHLENISGAIQEVLLATNLEPGSLNGLAVAVGPGSFSGIRVGMSLFKGLSLALGLKICGVSTLEILAWQALEMGDLGVPVIEAGRGQVYSGFFRKSPNGIETIQSPILVNKSELADFIARFETARVFICGDKELIVDVLEEGEVNLKPALRPSPYACGVLAEKRLNLGLSDDIHQLAPLYVRRSDAEVKKGAIRAC
jgi:tRNA threonylcarbamoyladenosine biosynthesis protein TsaB